MSRFFGGALMMALMMLSPPAMASKPVMMLDYATAASMQDTCRNWAAERGLEMAIAIYDDAGRLISFAHMDGARTGSNALARDKAKSAAGYRMATADMADMNLGSVPGVVPVWGGVAFTTKDGKPLGAMGVSGGAGAEDVACAAIAIKMAGLLIVGE